MTLKSNRDPNHTTKHHIVVSIQLNICACPAFSEIFIQDNVITPFVLVYIVTIVFPWGHLGPD